VYVLELAIRPALAGVTAPEQPSDEAGGRVGEIAPLMAFGRLVYLMPCELAGYPLDVGRRHILARRKLFGASFADSRTAAVELFTELKALFRIARDVVRRFEPGLVGSRRHGRLPFSALAVCAALAPVLALFTMNCGFSGVAATLWPLIWVADVAFFTTLPVEWPPLEFHSTSSPTLGSLFVFRVMVTSALCNGGPAFRFPSRQNADPLKMRWSTQRNFPEAFGVSRQCEGAPVRNRKIIQDVGWITAAVIGTALIVPTLLQKGESARDATEKNAEKGRTSYGYSADEPTQIPPRGWIDILRRTYDEVGKDRVLAVAAGVTFYGLLALFPALTAFVSIYGLMADTATIAGQLAAIDGFLPAGATDFLRDQIVRITAGGTASLSFAFAISLAIALWSANAGVKAIFDALNVAYGEAEKRGFLTLNLISLSFTSGILIFVLLAVGAVAAIPVILDFLYLGEATEWLIALGRWPILIVVLITGLAILYRFGPSRDDAKWTWVSPGAIFASLGWLIASLLFSWYVANFEDYNKTYGAIGAVIGLMTWMWLSATIVLVGAELNSEAERQTDRDTTEGTPMPIGLRGADAADRKP
jgi:membrane protein